MRSVVVVQGFYEWKVRGCFHLSVGRDYFDCAYVSRVPVYNIPRRNARGRPCQRASQASSAAQRSTSKVRSVIDPLAQPTDAGEDNGIDEHKN